MQASAKARTPVEQGDLDAVAEFEALLREGASEIQVAACVRYGHRPIDLEEGLPPTRRYRSSSKASTTAWKFASQSSDALCSHVVRWHQMETSHAPRDPSTDVRVLATPGA